MADRRPWGVRAASGALTALLLAGAVACSHDDPPAAAVATPPPADPVVVNEEDGTGGTLRLAIVGPDTIDPAQIVPTDPAEAITADLLFDGLTTIDPKTSEAKPALADLWDANSDFTSWNFRLRKDATFSDGTPITAADVKYSLERVVLRGKLSLAGPRLDVVQGFKELQAGTATELSGITTIGDDTLSIDLSEPYAGLAELVASPSFGVVSKAAFSSGLPSVAFSGGFELASRDATTARLTKREGASVKLDAVELLRFPDDESAWAAFTKGEVEWVLVPPAHRDEAIKTYGESAFTPLGATAFLGFNLVDPLFVDPRLRRAIFLALDRDALAAVVPAGRTPQRAIVPPGVPGALAEDCGRPCRHDVDEAKKLLAELYPSGVIPEIKLTVPSGGPEKRVADEVYRQLTELDVPVTVNALEFSEYLQFSTSGRQQMFWYGWAGLFPDPDAYLGRLFLTASKDNVTGFHSEDIDSAIAEARATGDRGQRFARYKEIERTLMEDVSVIPVAAYRLEVVVSPKVRNLRWRLDGTFVVPDVWVKP